MRNIIIIITLSIVHNSHIISSTSTSTSEELEIKKADEEAVANEDVKVSRISFIIIIIIQDKVSLFIYFFINYFS